MSVVRIIEVYLKKIHKNFVGTLETVLIRELSVPQEVRLYYENFE